MNTSTINDKLRAKFNLRNPRTEQERIIIENLIKTEINVEQLKLMAVEAETLTQGLRDKAYDLGLYNG